MNGVKNMTEAMEKLYDLVAGTIQMDEEQKKRLEALSVAKKGVLEALETPGAKPSMELWNVLASLDGQAEELREKAMFQEGLALGLELGRLRPRGMD